MNNKVRMRDIQDGLAMRRDGMTWTGIERAIRHYRGDPPDAYTLRRYILDRDPSLVSPRGVPFEAKR